MSSSSPPDSGGSDQPFGRRYGKAPEKSNFAHTCSLLSQYFKERGALGVASKLEAASKARSEMSPAAPGTEANLLPNMEKSVETPDLYTKLASPSTSMSMEEDTESKVEFRVPTTQGPRIAPMTIFYAGEVLVYDDFPSDKAREVMALAGKHVRSYSVIGTPGVDKISFAPVVVPVSDIVPTPQNREFVKQQPQTNSSFLVPTPRNREPAQQQSYGSNKFPVPTPREPAKQQLQENGSGHFLVPTPREPAQQHSQANGSGHFLVPTPREPAQQHSQANGSDHFLVPTPREPAQQHSQANGSGHFLVPAPREPAQQHSQANGSDHFLVPTPREPAQQHSQANGSGHFLVPTPREPAQQHSQANGSGNFLVPTPKEPAQQQSQASASGNFLVPTSKEPVQQQSQVNAPNNFLVPAPKELVQPQSQANNSGNIVVSMTGIEQPSKQKSQANESDLPIARRASLHRFFSKRKDRAAAKAPYQVNGPLNLPPPEAAESRNPRPEMGSSEGQSSKQHIDLNL